MTVFYAMEQSRHRSKCAECWLKCDEFCARKNISTDGREHGIGFYKLSAFSSVSGKDQWRGKFWRRGWSGGELKLLAKCRGAGARVLFEKLDQVRRLAESKLIRDFFDWHFPLRQQSPRFKDDLLFDKFFRGFVQRLPCQRVEFFGRARELARVILHTTRLREIALDQAMERDKLLIVRRDALIARARLLDPFDV